ncbi:MAG: septum formation inhibitor Maf [bacterium]
MRKLVHILSKSYVAGVFCLGLVLLSCISADSKEESGPAPADGHDFGEYWYAGEAELTRYELEQARYGEIRKGDAVLIFVTEDFLSDKQVKYEFGDKASAVSVLKLNFTRKFYTGIYPYSIMTSIFTPVEVQKRATLKVTTSAQEWCGHTFMQLNNQQGQYAVQLRSYFQSEGDADFKIDSALLEDEVWTRIRLAPGSLPTGEIDIVPGTQFARLRHVPFKVEKATATRETLRDAKLSAGDIEVYSLDYKDLQRTLRIKYEKAFPYRILAWEETHPSGFGPNAKLLSTRAVKSHSIKLPYWSRNKLSDSHLRDELGIIY